MSKHTHTVVVNIGRMVGKHELGPLRWIMFKEQVFRDLLEAGCDVVQRPQFGRMRAHDQVGTWEGCREPAASFTALITGYRNIAALRTQLAITADEYEQDAIACIVTLGTDHLVLPL